MSEAFLVKHVNEGPRQLKCDATVLKITMEKGTSENMKWGPSGTASREHHSYRKELLLFHR